MAAHDELKQKGNDCIREKKYQEAMGYYTDALRHDPSSHTVYSNRSLAHSKLGRFDAALEDANKCIELAPGFARGYVRKSVALIGQGEYEKAMTASEDGYKLRGSDAICRDCVAQWLEANQAHHKELVKKCLQDINLPEDIIPKGCRIISSDYLTIFLNILLCRLESTTTGVKVEFMAAYILKLLQELDRILQLFGHSPAAVAEEWLTVLCLCSKVDPSTYRVPQAYVAALLGKADEFAIWLDVNVDHILYPIVCPIMSLIVMAVTARCISLNVLNTNQPVTLVSCQACLPFFEKSLLSTAVYSMQLIALYKELLEAFGGSNFTFTSQEEKFGNECIKKLEALLATQPPTDADSKDVYEKAMVSIALGRLRLGQSPGFDPVAYAPESGKAISRSLYSDPEKLKAYVKEKQELLKGDLELKEGTHLMEGAYEDMQDLLFCIGSLLKIGENEMAVEAFHVAESSYEKLFRQQISKKSFDLDNAGMAFSIPQTIVLPNVAPFLAVDDQLTANGVIRWKCLSSEFRAVLIRLGVGKRYMKTFQAIQQMRVDVKLDQESLMEVAGQHQVEASKFLNKTGQLVLIYLLKQSCERIQNTLQPDQLLLEYCCLRVEETDSDTPNGVLVVLRPKGKALVYSVDFQKALPMAETWSKLASDPKVLEEAISIAKKLCSVLIPTEVQALIDSPDVRRLFLCPDASLSVLPLELLCFDDGKTLGEKCSTTYLSSARELLRNEAVMAITTVKEMVAQKKAGKEDAAPAQSTSEHHTEDGEESSAAEDTSFLRGVPEPPAAKEGVPEPPAAKEGVPELPAAKEGVPELPAAKGVPEPPAAKEGVPELPAAKEFIIIFAPNYNLEKPAPEESGLWESVVKGFASLFSEPLSGPKLPEALPSSETEAAKVKEIISKSANPVNIRELKGDDANMMSVLQLEAPFILHFSTHGFSRPDPQGVRSSFWNDTKSGILLAGSNTYYAGKLAEIVPEAGTGELTSLAACGMNLNGTRLVFLSTCVSSYGLYSYSESVNSLAQAFRSAGAQTVIATLWQVVDDTAQHFAAYFYEEAFKSGVTPSQAVVRAKERVKEETTYKHWLYWSGFVCIGEDHPLFP